MMPSALCVIRFSILSEHGHVSHNSEGIGTTNSHSGSLAGQSIVNKFPTYNNYKLKGATYTDKSACRDMIATQCCTITKRYFVQS